MEPTNLPGFLKVAERMGFEPMVGYKPTHAFQACALNHSAISPLRNIVGTNLLERQAHSPLPQEGAAQIHRGS